eukprot:SAG31_NODE_3359_length_4366_cov_64.369815_4_plen_41_part_00
MTIDLIQADLDLADRNYDEPVRAPPALADDDDDDDDDDDN